VASPRGARRDIETLLIGSAAVWLSLSGQWRQAVHCVAYRLREELIKPETRRALWRVYTDTDLVLSAFAVTVQVSTLMLVRKIGTVFVHHGYPHPPLTHQLSHRICTDLKIDTGEGWGATAPACPPVATPL